jgi:hypothetical protein
MKSTDTRQVEKERKPVHRLTPFTLAALGSQNGFQNFVRLY